MRYSCLSFSTLAVKATSGGKPRADNASSVHERYPARSYLALNIQQYQVVFARFKHLQRRLPVMATSTLLPNFSSTERATSRSVQCLPPAAHSAPVKAYRFIKRIIDLFSHRRCVDRQRKVEPLPCSLVTVISPPIFFADDEKRPDQYRCRWQVYRHDCFHLVIHGKDFIQLILRNADTESSTSKCSISPSS